MFSILQLPIPHGRNGRVPIEKCLDAFFNEEILEKDDAWYVANDCMRKSVELTGYLVPLFHLRTPRELSSNSFSLFPFFPFSLFPSPLFFVPCHIPSTRDCPKCKTKRRASKTLSLARLPPVLLIHFKRFEANGRFSDKIDTFVEYPMKSLDLTNYMPAPLPPGADRSELNGGLPMSLDDPRTQLPPYRYDLYAVTNHYGNLTSGHCRFFSLYC